VLTFKLLLQVLQQVSETLSKDGVRRNAGYPTALAVAPGALLIAIGTTHGLVLVFDRDQRMQIILGTTEGADNGPVTAVDISPTSDWIAVGHQNGHIVIWDVSNGSPIKTITQHTAPITFIRFVQDRTHVVSVDLRGEMYQFNLTKMFMVYIVETIQVMTGGSGKAVWSMLR